MNHCEGHPTGSQREPTLGRDQVALPVQYPGDVACCGTIWRTFAEALKFPDEELLECIRDGTLATQLRHLLKAEMNIAAFSDEDVGALKNLGEHEDDLQIEYTRLFDGAAGGSCSLHGSLQPGRPQMQTLEEIVRFYNHFGVTLSPSTTEMPDHLTVELEFLHCLAYGEADLLSRNEDPSSYGRARRDFIARHPGRCVSQIRHRLSDLKPMPYFEVLFRLLEHCLQADLGRLTMRYGPASKPKMHIYSY